MCMAHYPHNLITTRKIKGERERGISGSCRKSQYSQSHFPHTDAPSGYNLHVHVHVHVDCMCTLYMYMSLIKDKTIYLFIYAAGI